MTTIYDNWEKMYDSVDDLTREMTGDEDMSGAALPNPVDRLAFLNAVKPLRDFIHDYLDQNGIDEVVGEAAEHIIERKLRLGELNIESQVESIET